jgi:hypothetical protein
MSPNFHTLPVAVETQYFKGRYQVNCPYLFLSLLDTVALLHPQFPTLVMLKEN